MDTLYWRGGSFEDYRLYVDVRVRAAILEILATNPFAETTARDRTVDAIVVATAFAQLAPDGGTPSTDAHIHLWGTVPLLRAARRITRAVVGHATATSG